MKYDKDELAQALIEALTAVEPVYKECATCRCCVEDTEFADGSDICYSCKDYNYGIH